MTISKLVRQAMPRDLLTSAELQSERNGAAIKVAIHLYAMSNHSTVTVLADGRYSLNRTFQAVERVLNDCRDRIEALVIFVTSFGGQQPSELQIAWQ
jgi:hypothetical protein